MTHRLLWGESWKTLQALPLPLNGYAGSVVCMCPMVGTKYPAFACFVFATGSTLHAQ